MTYEVTFTVTYKTTVQVDGNDEEDAYHNLESMIEDGKLDLDLEKDLLEYEIDEDSIEDISEGIYYNDLYTFYSEKGVFR